MHISDPVGNKYRDAWSRFATGVTVITTVEPDGSVHGMTASSVTSVSIDPPLVLAVIGETRQTHTYIGNTGRFGMSILNENQRDIAMHFADPHKNGTQLDASFVGNMSGIPVIAKSIAAMGCRVIAAHKAGDHTVFIGEVESIQLDDGNPLVWFQREFVGFSDSSVSADRDV